MRLTTNGIGIEYVVEGPRTGVPVVFIHGFPFSREMWAPQIDALKRDFYVISYDIRGHGRSDVGDGQYSIEYFADDLIALLDHLKISKAVLVGLSMGGYIALRVHERNPERVRALALCDTRSEPDSNEAKVRRAIQARDVKANGTTKFAETFLPIAFYEKSFERSPDAIELIRSIIIQTSSISIAGTLLAMAARTDTTPSLYGVKVPTLILVGKYDSPTPPSASHAMKEKIPGSVLHIIPDAGHLSNLENPEVFNRHLLEFLTRIK